jgi:hypothetical protein
LIQVWLYVAGVTADLTVNWKLRPRGSPGRHLAVYRSSTLSNSTLHSRIHEQAVRAVASALVHHKRCRLMVIPIAPEAAAVCTIAQASLSS